MTEKDIRMVYKQETGKYPVKEYEDGSDTDDMENYIRWLENKIIELSDKSKF